MAGSDRTQELLPGADRRIIVDAFRVTELNFIVIGLLILGFVKFCGEYLWESEVNRVLKADETECFFSFLVKISIYRGGKWVWKSET